MVTHRNRWRPEGYPAEMSGSMLRRVALAVILVAVAGCGPSTSQTTVPPQPATPAEMEQFCQAYESVRMMSWSEMTAELIEASPAEIKAQMIRTSQPPGETWEEDRRAVEDFMQRCDDL